MTIAKAMGCLIGFAGVVIVNLNGSGLDRNMSFAGEGCIFLSTIAYACSSVLIKDYSKKENPVILSGYQFFFGGLVMIACGLAAGGRLVHITGVGIAMLLYLGLLSAISAVRSLDPSSTIRISTSSPPGNKLCTHFSI